MGKKELMKAIKIGGVAAIISPIILYGGYAIYFYWDDIKYHYRKLKRKTRKD